MGIRSRPLVASLVAFGLSASPLLAQVSTVVGIVRDDSTRGPVVGAEVVLEALGRRTASGSGGRFVLADLVPGLRRILVRAVGYHPTEVTVALTAGDTSHIDVTLELRPVELAPIEVVARPIAPRGIGREAFEERRRLGFGRFLDSTELRRSEHLRLADLLRRSGGLEIQGGKALSGRYRDPAGRPNCYLQVILDGSVLARGGRHIPPDSTVPLAAPDLRTFIDVAALEAVEIYRSAAQVPTEYGGASAACGAILLWTRRAP